MITLTVFSLHLASGVWLPRDVMDYHRCLADAAELTSVAEQVVPSGGRITILHGGVEIEIVGVKCEPIDCEDEPTS